MKYKYTRKQIADRLESFYYGNRKEGDFVNDLLAKEQGKVYKAKGKTFDEQLDYAMGGSVAKKQGEKKPKKKCKFCDEPQCECFGRYCYTHRKNCPKPTPPLKEDRREIKPLDVPSNDLKTWPTNEIMIYHKLCEIIDVINHLSSVEK